MSWTPMNEQVNSVAVEIVRIRYGASYINPVTVALQLSLAKTILERAYEVIPEIVIGLINADVNRGLG